MLNMFCKIVKLPLSNTPYNMHMMQAVRGDGDEGEDLPLHATRTRG